MLLLCKRFQLPHSIPLHAIAGMINVSSRAMTHACVSPQINPRVKVSIVESLRDREVACSASDRQGSNFESCVWRTESSQSSHHPQEVLLAQFSLYVHKGGLKPDSFHFPPDQTVSLLALFLILYKKCFPHAGSRFLICICIFLLLYQNCSSHAGCRLSISVVIYPFFVIFSRIMFS